MFKKLAAVLALTALVGCQSVPMLTQLRMLTFGRDDFVQLNPDDIKAIFEIYDGVEFSKSEQTIAITTYNEATDETHEHEFSFTPKLSEYIAFQERFGFDQRETHIYYFSLTEEAKQSFRELQQQAASAEFSARGFAVSTSFDFNSYFEKYHDFPREISYKVALQFDADDGYLTIIEEDSVMIAWSDDSLEQLRQSQQEAQDEVATEADANTNTE